MDVPNQALSGIALIEQVISLTGLPEDLIGQEFVNFIREKGITPEQITLDDLRGVLLQYLESTAEEEAEIAHIN